MLNLSFNLLWNLVFFCGYVYLISIISIIFFIIPFIKTLNENVQKKKETSFECISGLDILNVLIYLIATLLGVLSLWSGVTATAWFSHLIFSNFQFKTTFLVIATFGLIALINGNSFYFSSKETYDYTVVISHLLLWVIVLFFTNSLLAIIFIVEILSTLIFLLLATSTFSSTHYYNNLNLNLHNYFNDTLPFFFIQTLLFFFWISLVSSLNLFFALLHFYINFLTFDWFIIENFFIFLMSCLTLKNFIFLIFTWFNFLFCIFLKCGLVPFFFWKPTFFKGIPLNLFFFYITFFYFFIFLFFVIFFLIYLTEVFYHLLVVNVIMLAAGFSLLLAALLEAFYLKTFLALSSILNTLFIFLILNSINTLDFLIIFV